MRSYTCTGVQGDLERAAQEAQPFGTAMVGVQTLEDAARLISGQRADLVREYRTNERLRGFIFALVALWAVSAVVWFLAVDECVR